MNCTKCGKKLGKIKGTCPACKVPFCFRCMTEHITAKVCAYGKTLTLLPLEEQ